MTLAALVAVSVVLFAAVLPPRPIVVSLEGNWDGLANRTVAGAYHIHTKRSDGAGDRTEIAAAASRAGLRFIILTDHGDGTRPPDPPAYIDGVLILDAVEISTDGGHYAALDMPRAPYPLAGAPQSVVEDVARLGGFGIVAHPDSPKPALRWTDDTLPIDGIEWMNADSEWRDEGRAALLRAGLTYWLRPAPSLATLLDRPVTLDRWDALTRSREVATLAGIDAHGGIGRRTQEGSRGGFLGIPSYEAGFRTFSNRVVLDRPLTGDPAEDARLVYGAIRAGRAFTSIDALAAPALLDFHAEQGNGARAVRTEMGGLLPTAADAKLVARVSLPDGAQVVLLNNGREVARGNGAIAWPVADGGGAFRVEVRLAHAPGQPPIPWLVSNPIYIGVARKPVSTGAPPMTVLPTIPPFPWRIEKDPSSSAIVRSGAHDVTLEYQLGRGERHSQFVALATDVHDAAFSAVDLGLAADRPMRASIEVRTAGGDRRWARSVYVDATARRFTIPLSTLRPVGATDLPPLRVENVTSILVVIDLTNSFAGRSGTLSVLSSALVK